MVQSKYYPRESSGIMRCTLFFTVKKGKKKKNSKQRNKEMSDTAEDNASELDKLSIQDKQRSADSQVSSSDGAVHSSEGAVHPTGGTVDSFGGAHSSSLLAAPYNEIFSPYPVWSRISSSESEYSDTEGAQSSKLRSYNCRVRQCALGVFHALIKVSNVPVLCAFLRKSGYYVAHIMSGYFVPEF